MKKLQNRKGFTLVELLIVIAIIGILVLIAVPRFAKTTEISKVRTLQANTRTIAGAAGLYIADNGGNEPADVNALVAGKYLNNNLNDKPKGATYSFTASSASSAASVTGTMELSKGLDATSIANLTSEGVAFSGTDNKTVTIIINVN